MNEEKDDSKCVSSQPPFLPMSSPFPPTRKPKSKTPNSATFTVEKVEKFQHMFENGYDVVTDERYNQWLYLNYPAEAASLLNSSVPRYSA